MNLDEQIQAYLDGEMSEPDRATFEIALNEQSSLRQKYEEYLVAQQIAKGLVEIDVRAELLRLKESQSSPKAKKSWLWIILAIVLLIACILLYRSNNPKKSQIFANLYEEPLWDVQRSEGEPYQKAIADFLSEGDVEKAKKAIQLDSDLDYTLKQYWIAEMYLKAEILDSAIYYLPEVPESHLKHQRIQRIKSWLK